MKQSLIFGAELSEFGFPILPAVNVSPTDTIDFRESLSRTLSNYANKSVNFYLHDEKFESVWNSPDRYIDHFRAFDCILGLDYSIDTQMPLVMQMWNKYRNHALDYYFSHSGIRVIPNINILPEQCWPWCWQGLPEQSTLCCSTNGRVKSKAARLEFCRCFAEMERQLNPFRVILVGHEIPELQPQSEIIYLKSRNQRMKEAFNDGNKH